MVKIEKQLPQREVPKTYLKDIADQERFIEDRLKEGCCFGNAEKTYTLIYHRTYSGDDVIGIVLYGGASALSKARWKALINS